MWLSTNEPEQELVNIVLSPNEPEQELVNIVLHDGGHHVLRRQRLQVAEQARHRTNERWRSDAHVLVTTLFH